MHVTSVEALTRFILTSSGSQTNWLCMLLILLLIKSTPYHAPSPPSYACYCLCLSIKSVESTWALNKVLWDNLKWPCLCIFKKLLFAVDSAEIFSWIEGNLNFNSTAVIDNGTGINIAFYDHKRVISRSLCLIKLFIISSFYNKCAWLIALALMETVISFISELDKLTIVHIICKYVVRYSSQ